MAKNTCISVYEHDRLKLGETEQFLPEHLSLLQQYLGEKGHRSVSILSAH